MAKVLSDIEIKKLFGSTIKKADENCLRPNSYVMRMGAEGEFISTGKRFNLNKGNKKGIIVDLGHSVGVTSYEDIDLRRETVQKTFPNCDIHAFVSPTTDLSREGIMAPTTQVDAGFYGTLNWTFTNNSNAPCEFIFKEKIYRITFLLLSEGECPEFPYDGDYQGKMGYLPSEREGRKRGMKDSDFDTAFIKGGAEDLLEQIAKTSSQQAEVAKRLIAIDGKFEDVSKEYSDIFESLQELNQAVRQGKEDTHNIVRNVFNEQVGALNERWLNRSSLALTGVFGVGLTLFTSDFTRNILVSTGSYIGPTVVLACISFWLISRKR